MPPNFYDEVLHRFFAKNVVDLTAGNGEFMLQSVRNRVGYFGICLTSIHKTELEKMARIYILKVMCDETCALYSPKCAEAFKKCGVVDKEGEQQGEEQAKRKRKKKGDSEEDGEKSISDLSESGQSEWDLSDDTA